MNYDLWKSTEPDDSDVRYYKNWEQAEKAAKRMVESAKRMNEREVQYLAEKAKENNEQKNINEG